VDVGGQLANDVEDGGARSERRDGHGDLLAAIHGRMFGQAKLPVKVAFSRIADGEGLVYPAAISPLASRLTFRTRLFVGVLVLFVAWSRGGFTVRRSPSVR